MSISQYASKENRLAVGGYREANFNKPHYLTRKMTRLLNPDGLVIPMRRDMKHSTREARGKRSYFANREIVSRYHAPWSLDQNFVRPADVAFWGGLALSNLASSVQNSTDSTYLHKMSSINNPGTLDLWTTCMTCYIATPDLADDGDFAGEDVQAFDGVGCNSFSLSYAIGSDPTFSAEGIASGSYSNLEIGSNNYKQKILSGLTGASAPFNAKYYNVEPSPYRPYNWNGDPLLEGKLAVYLYRRTAASIGGANNLFPDASRTTRNFAMDLTDNDLASGAVNVTDDVLGFNFTYSNGASAENNRVAGKRAPGFFRRGPDGYSIAFDLTLRRRGNQVSALKDLLAAQSDADHFSVQICMQGSIDDNSKQGVLITLPEMFIGDEGMQYEEQQGQQAIRMPMEPFEMETSTETFAEGVYVDVVDLEADYHRPLSGLPAAAAAAFNTAPNQTNP